MCWFQILNADEHVQMCRRLLPPSVGRQYCCLLLLNMKSLMSVETGVAPKGLLTILTVVRFPLGVGSLVLSEVGTEAKGFATYITDIRLLPSVDPLMLCKICSLGKGFPTFATHVWFLASVNSPVNGKA